MVRICSLSPWPDPPGSDALHVYDRGELVAELDLDPFRDPGFDDQGIREGLLLDMLPEGGNG